MQEFINDLKCKSLYLVSATEETLQIFDLNAGNALTIIKSQTVSSAGTGTSSGETIEDNNFSPGF